MVVGAVEVAIRTSQTATRLPHVESRTTILGKPTTTATALTTNGDARKDTNAAAPASVEGAADGLSDPATNASTETPGTAEPWGTTIQLQKHMIHQRVLQLLRLSKGARYHGYVLGSNCEVSSSISTCITVIKLPQTYTKTYTSPSTRTTSPHTCRSAAIDFLCATAISTSN
jgi:hypothetical protein